MHDLLKLNIDDINNKIHRQIKNFFSQIETTKYKQISNESSIALDKVTIKLDTKKWINWSLYI